MGYHPISCCWCIGLFCGKAGRGSAERQWFRMARIAVVMVGSVLRLWSCVFSCSRDDCHVCSTLGCVDWRMCCGVSWRPQKGKLSCNWCSHNLSLMSLPKWPVVCLTDLRCRLYGRALRVCPSAES